ncbi:hypothetical protein Ahy_A03g010934 [Arachis hypogaea]|uniref:Uncharacterized protein n=1 Tax=Arachis hypogaea TaxID=3818 RepID=A0A445DP19_ARAHY|nr:hypothetical protein Ahy_A03g010934 [Arachis hypogaea]
MVSECGRIPPFFQQSYTQSARFALSSHSSVFSVGLLPQATSSRNAPKPNTSDIVVALPVLICSGAIYPKVPAT